MAQVTMETCRAAGEDTVEGADWLGGIRAHIPDEGRFTFRPTAHKMGDGVGVGKSQTEGDRHRAAEARTTISSSRRRSGWLEGRRRKESKV